MKWKNEIQRRICIVWKLIEWKNEKYENRKVKKQPKIYKSIKTPLVLILIFRNFYFFITDNLILVQLNEYFIVFTRYYKNKIFIVLFFHFLLILLLFSNKTIPQRINKNNTLNVSRLQRKIIIIKDKYKEKLLL